MSVQARGSATRQRVLATALPIFAREGARTKIEDICTASGVSVGSIYHHFGSRDGIVTTLYAQSLASLLESIAQAVVDCTSAAAGIDAFVHAYLDWMDNHPDNARVIFSISSYEINELALAASAAAKSEPLAMLTAWFQRFIRSRDIVDLPPWLVEVVLVGPLAEYSQRRLSGALPPHDDSEVRAALASTACHAIRL